MKAILTVLLIIIALNVVDVWSTVQIIAKGGIELNPIFKEINEQAIGLKMGFIFFASALVVKTYNQAIKEESKPAKRIIWAVLIGITGFYSYVIINNMVVLFTI